MLCALTVRKLQPGKFDELMKVMDPGSIDAPAGWKRFYALRNVADENEVITFGFFDGTLEELRASQQDTSSGRDYQQVRSETDQLVDSVGADGIYEIVEEQSMGG
jgi:hypothetical protein